MRDPALGSTVCALFTARLRPASQIQAAILLALCLPVEPAFAGQEPPTDSSSQLAEIVITAEKRESTVEKTPISITAVSGQELQNRGISSFTDLAQQTPGVSLRTSGPGKAEIEMRGLSSSGGESPTVGFYLDEIPVTAAAGATNGKAVIDPNLYDLERVEVLRGPQGTLYGAGSMGGTVRLITAPPVLNRFDASGQFIGSGTQGGGFNHGENAMVNLPIVEGTLALRLVGSYSQRSGWIDRVVLNDFPLEVNYSPLGSSTPGVGTIRGNVLAAPVAQDFRNVNDASIETFRANLLFRPTEQLSVTAAGFYQRTDQGGLDAYDQPPGTLAHYQPYSVAEPYSDLFKSVSLTVKYAIPDLLEITAATSYFERSTKQVEDGSENWQDAFGEPTFTPGAAYVEIDTTRQFAAELRVASTSQAAFQWQVGGFYSRYHSGYFSSGVDQGFVDLYGFDSSNVYTAFEPFEITQKALFGQLSYQFSTQWKLAAGLRRYSFDSSVSSSSTGILATAPGGGSASSSGVNPSFTLSYTPNNDALLYATAAKGFRPGGANVPVPTSLCAQSLAQLGRSQSPLQYNPDSLWSYELGEKARLADSRVSVNGAVYYERWSGVQQVINLSCGFLYTDNAAVAEVYGTELEVQTRISSAWTVAVTGGYTHGALTATEPGTSFNKGDRLQNVPNATASAWIEYRRPLGSVYTAVARATGEYVGNRVDLTYGVNQVPGYGLANIRAGLVADKWSAFLFVDNLANRQAQLGNNSNLDVNIPSVNRVVSNQPRTIGLELNRSF